MEAKEDSSHNQKVASKTNKYIQNCTKKKNSQMNENQIRLSDKSDCLINETIVK